VRVLNRILLFSVLFSVLIAGTLRTSGLDYQVYLAEFIDPLNELSSREIGYVALINLVEKYLVFGLFY